MLQRVKNLIQHNYPSYMNVLFATVRASEIGGNYFVCYLCTIIEEAVHDANST